MVFVFAGKVASFNEVIEAIAMDEQTEEQAYTESYKAWMAAALEAAGGKYSKLHRELTSNFGINYHNDNGGAIVRTWFYDRLTLPNDTKWPMLSSLISFIDEHVPYPPRGTIAGISFADNVKYLAEIRFSNQLRGRKVDDVNKSLFETGALAFPVCKFIELDEVEDLALGSSVFHGELPPYCSREKDNEIISF